MIERILLATDGLGAWLAAAADFAAAGEAPGGAGFVAMGRRSHSRLRAALPDGVLRSAFRRAAFRRAACPVTVVPEPGSGH